MATNNFEWTAMSKTEHFEGCLRLVTQRQALKHRCFYNVGKLGEVSFA